MLKDEYYYLYKKTEVNGCVMEDGADTRTYSSKYILIPESQLESFQESCADDYGYQDYSYQVDYKEVLSRLSPDSLKEIYELIKTEIEGSTDETE